MAATGEMKPTEDAVEYRLFPHIPEDCSQDETQKYLEELTEICIAHLSEYLMKYIWQNEPFHVKPVFSETGNEPPHLYGTTNFGDNIEDEWFIVYLLRELSEEFPGLLVQVNDNDGEFLLIEAANSLPRWVTPDTADNRVFLYEGTLHIIPYPTTPAHIAVLPAGVPTLVEAINCIRSYPSMTMAQAQVQGELQIRLQGYPEKVDSSTHHSHCYIPASLAAVIEHSPSLVAPMVQAFYYRDPVDLKACITFQNFQPGTRVMRNVRLTRCLYAQLKQQRFTPDKRSGFSLPATSNPKYKAYDLGAKIAHGAEILCSKCGTPSGADDLKHVTSDPRWSRYLATLNAKGYFKGELEGSQKYQKMLSDAKKHFLKSFGNRDSTRACPGTQILQALKQVIYDIEDMKKEETTLPSPDDDSWLNITPEELDAMLERTSGKRANPSDVDKLHEMTDGVKAFVNKVSSHEGAELPNSDDCDIQFDPNSFMQSMQKVFEFEDSDGASSSDLSEYASDDDLGDYSSGHKSKKKGQGHAEKGQNGDEFIGSYLGLDNYMDVMDRELAKTTIGQSFEKEPSPHEEPLAPKAPPRKKKQAKLASQTSPSSQPGSTRSTPQAVKPGTEKRKGSAPKATLDDEDICDEDEDFRPVDVDINIVKNLMESYQSQAGVAGPASNLLGSMGIQMPQDRGRETEF